MRPWIGVVAVATTMLVAPATALAGPNDPALLKFQLENSADYDDFERLGFDMDHAVENGEGGGVVVRAWVTDEQLALARAHGYRDVGVVHDKFNIDRIRADNARSVAAEKAAKDALRTTSVAKAKAAVPKSVRAQRADFYENNVGRFLSIEANTDGVTFTGANGTVYEGPTIMAEWFDAAGNRMGGGTLAVYRDPDVTPDYYQYHYQVFRIGNKGDGGPDPALIKIASSNGDTDTIVAKEWLAKNPPGNSAGFKSGFVERYYNGQEAHKKVRDLAAEFPNIAEAIKLPEQTRGYQRKAQTMLGYNATTPYVTFDANNLPVAGAAPSTAAQPSTVVLTSKAYGHVGGNTLTAQLVAPTGPDQALSVSLNGNALRVNLASNADSAVTSTANDVIAAINAHPAAGQIVLAQRYRTASGAGVVTPGPVSPLSDLLRAPSTVQRGPMDEYVLRINNKQDVNTKVGVFLYCQEHGNEIATSGVCLETAERLVRNYGTDPKTTEYVNNLDIFIVPQINPDGATHSLYDANRRKNLSHHCDDTAMFTTNVTDPGSRNSWGVDLNRNFSIGSIFDGFQGASFTNCTSGNFAGLFEFSEPEARNESWVQSNFPNIKFANNIHSSGGYFMWPPGAYTPQRVPLPYPPYGTLNFFDQTAQHVLDGIKSHRGTAIRPQRTGPVIDVLYSAAGNSADEAYYAKGIIGYDFEIGDVNYYVDPVTGVERTCNAGQQPPFGDSANDCLDNEGWHEAQEFAAGNYGLLQSALEYSRDTAAPVVEVTSSANGIDPVYEVRFTSNEASSIYYTTDGSTPTTASTEYKPPRARALPLPLTIAPGTTLKWIAHDFKGNMSAVKSQSFGWNEETGSAGGTVPATLALTMGTASFGAFTPGIAKTYTASGAATVTSSAGDALLSVADPSSTHTGHLVNGSFALAQPLQARVGSAALANVGSAAAPLALRTWTAPVSNDTFAIDYSQAIGANEALRTGAYSKTLTYTLSTTQP